jgi:2-acylglycerol O-acyltransferase 2
MRGLLERGRSVLLIPGGVAECLRMTPSCEVVYLRKRFGFVKLAMQTGAQLVPAYSFGQTRTYSYWKLGPPLCSDATTSALSKVIGLAPMAFWGRWGTPMPRQAKVHTVVGKAIPVEKRVDPTNEEVAAKLEEFIGAVKGLFERHRGENGYGDVELVVL